MMLPSLTIPRHWSRTETRAVIEFLEAFIEALWQYYEEPYPMPEPPKAHPKTSSDNFDDLPF